MKNDVKRIDTVTTEMRINDLVYSIMSDEFDTMADDCESVAEEFEKLYPGYFLADAGAFHNDVCGGQYIAARFYRRDGKFIKPKRAQKQKRRRKE